MTQLQLIYKDTDDLFLGFDLSTQQLKIIVTDVSLKLLDSFNVEFDEFKGEYPGLKKGVFSNGDTGEIVSPVGVWLESIDHLFGVMKLKGFPFDKVRGISGSGQQHGSVYWGKEAEKKLNKIKKGDGETEGRLVDILDGAFSLDTSPNWQDHSTGEEIKDFENSVGGSEELASITGSRAHYRFTGLQIRKIVKKKPEVYKETSRISLVSSFLATVLLGDFAHLELADACGMNLFDMNTKKYDEKLLNLAGSKEGTDGGNILEEKLGSIDPITYKSIGSIGSYFVDKYGFSSSTKIYSFTGDNLATILSLPLEENDILISLGTSTTVLLVTKQFAPSSQYHMFDHPTMPKHFMGMICYCNGSLAREKIRDEVNSKYGVESGWDKFDEILDSSDKFDHKLGIYFPLGEIVPNASAQTKRCVYENGNLKLVESWEIDEDVTSIIESQTLSCRVRLGPMLTKKKEVKENEKEKKFLKEFYDKFGEIQTDGKKQSTDSLLSRPNRVYFVGGSLKNESIVGKMASILGSTKGNFKVEMPNSCALGGAFKASWGFECESQGDWIDYNEYVSKNFDFSNLESVKVEDKWEEYFEGIGMLAKMELELDHE